jgi:hypothetical protein
MSITPRIACDAPGVGHVHWTLQPEDRYRVVSVEEVCRIACITDEAGYTTWTLAKDLVVCGTAGGPDPLPEEQALAEMLADLENDADPATADLREELASRLAHIGGGRAA